MRVLSLLLVAPLFLVPAVALADVAPDPDPWEACEMLKLGDACFSTEGRGYCVNMLCPDKPNMPCLYCDPNAMGTTGDATTTAGSTTAATEGTTAGNGSSSGGNSGSSGSSGGAGSSSSGSSGGESSGASDGGTSDGSSPEKAGGCGCRSDAGPAGALALLGLVALLHRRRR